MICTFCFANHACLAGPVYARTRLDTSVYNPSKTLGQTNHFGASNCKR